MPTEGAKSCFPASHWHQRRCPPPPELFGRGAGERSKARAGSGHVPRCQITRVMGTKHVHPKDSPSGGVLVALAPLCAFVALLQHPDWAWRLRQPKWIQASRAARRCIPRSWHQTSDSEIGTCEGCNMGWAGYLTSPTSSERSHFLSRASFVLVEVAWDFVARFLRSTKSICTY